MDYNQFEPDYPHQAFKDHRKKKCSGVKGKAHRNVTVPGDCDWLMDQYWWKPGKYWRWSCGCLKQCKNCGLISRVYNKCANKEFKELLRPKGVTD